LKHIFWVIFRKNLAERGNFFWPIAEIFVASQNYFRQAKTLKNYANYNIYIHKA
jgi:hypothetical protein